MPGPEVSISSKSTAARKSPGQFVGGETMIADNCSSWSSLRSSPLSSIPLDSKNAANLRKRHMRFLVLIFLRKPGLPNRLNAGLLIATLWDGLEK